jgi:hypothetical protein
MFPLAAAPRVADSWLLMMQAHSLTRRLGALGVIFALVGLVGQGMASAQTPLGEIPQQADQGDAAEQFRLGLMHWTDGAVPQNDPETELASTDSAVSTHWTHDGGHVFIGERGGRP